MTAPHLDPTLRHDTVLLFDVADGNPNGDPDADNEPRTDQTTGHGLVTDVALKRKIRDAVAARHGQTLWVSRGARLNDAIEQARDTIAKAGRKNGEAVEAARQLMCETHWDVRVFGGVMSTGKDSKGGAGRATGPYQLTFARSDMPIEAERHTIGRIASTDDDAGQTLGAKWTVPYAMYRSHGFWSPGNAASTGAGPKDLEQLWDAQEWMFNDDRSAARGLMAMRAVIVFTHDSPLGRAHAHDLHDLVELSRTDAVPRGTGDYTLGLPCDGGPVPGFDGVTLTVQYRSPALRIAVREVQ